MAFVVTATSAAPGRLSSCVCDHRVRDGTASTRRAHPRKRHAPAMTAEEFSPSLFESLDERLEMLIKDLVWWATALKIAREAG